MHESQSLFVTFGMLTLNVFYDTFGENFNTGWVYFVFSTDVASEISLKTG